MVNRFTLALGSGLLLVALLLGPLGNIRAQQLAYRVDKEYSKIWVNQDGTIDLWYDIKTTCISGRMTGFYVGMPNQQFRIGVAQDVDGTQVRVADASSGDNYRVDVTLLNPIVGGESSEFTLTVNVASMIYKDDMNPGNFGLQFVPTWFSDATVLDLRISIVLPPGAEPDKIKGTPNWSSTPVHDPNEEGRLTVYWESHNVGQGQKFAVGVSFPSSLMPNYTPEDGLFSLKNILLFAGVGFAVIATVVAGVIVLVNASRKAYQQPQMSVETLGVKAGLTAVEAAQLLDLPPQKVSIAVLYGLLRKNAVSVEGVQPNIKLRVSEQLPQLNYYEKDFISAIRPDGSLEEEDLARTIMNLRDTVDNKLRGYNRGDTVNYYRSVVGQAWKQVEAAQTPELASNLFNENQLWLMLDDKYADRTKEKFTPMVFIPSPDWWWWWNYNTMYLPHPAPTATTGGIPGKVSIPGADFANSVATALESGSSKIVTNIEKFTKSILPPPPSKAEPHEPVHHQANCVCACASCACACVCVSCACACASGGGH